MHVGRWLLSSKTKQLLKRLRGAFGCDYFRNNNIKQQITIHYSHPLGRDGLVPSFHVQ